MPILHNKKSIMKNLFIIFGILLIIFTIPVVVYFVNKQQELRTKAAPATTLTITPPTINKHIGETFSVDINMNTGSNQVVVAELYVLFDATKLEAQTITVGTLFPKIIVSGTIQPGQASITVSAENETQPITGTGTAVIVTFKTIAATTTPVSITLGPNTFVGALGESSTNVLTGSTPAAVVITTGNQEISGGTPTPTGVPLLSLIATPTIFSTITPSVPSTLSAGITPNAIASGSAQAASSALFVNVPRNDETNLSNIPTFQGRATPNSTVTIVIHSETITGVVVADSTGNWVYTPNTPLSQGQHTAIITVTNPETGAVETVPVTFTVSGQVVTETSQKGGMPTSGTIETTLLFITISVVLFTAGLFLPYLVH